MGFILLCNNCYSRNIDRYEGEMTEKGYDWFTCKECKHTFTLANASYESE